MSGRANAPKLCVALDRESRESNLALVRLLKSHSAHLWLKVGLRSFVRDGKEFLEDLRRIGDFRLFLDLKLYDIPNTMLDTMREIHALGVDMLTIHASSGAQAMRALARYRETNPTAPRILAVTALTSFGQEDFGQIYNTPILNHARNMAVLAYESGCDGVVCGDFLRIPRGAFERGVSRSRDLLQTGKRGKRGQHGGGILILLNRQIAAVRPGIGGQFALIEGLRGIQHFLSRHAESG